MSNPGGRKRKAASLEGGATPAAANPAAAPATAAAASESAATGELLSGRPILEEELVTSILASMGVDQYEDAVVHHLIESMHAFTEELLKDAYEYAVHANRKTTETDDLKLALQMKERVRALPSRETLMGLAQEVNQRPIPPIPDHASLRVPASHHLVMHRPFRVVPTKETTKTVSPSMAAAGSKVPGDAARGGAGAGESLGGGNKKPKAAESKIQINLTGATSGVSKTM
uniref:Transcription initiation factor TFIID subunit 12 domain-containing protein n=1 Tax=Rhizochromulina marina TaxID=1034831 RepID=A0A7S2R806_9STRA|mmetsp:Transcript_12422/g.35925  ORF Transcript_12422/g.35925 Transcript_12422/m.35925 type:complete len:230 (+) Transcript_12422:184-873(+)